MVRLWGDSMDSSENGKEQLWQLLKIVQKIEDTVTHSLTQSVERRFCKDEIEFRQRRNQLFPIGYFADAGWDVLLDLYAAHIRGRPISTTGLGLVGGVPQTTMLRYLDQLVRDGYAVRANDPRDGRRVFVELTEAGIKCMATLFDDGKLQAEQSAIGRWSGELSGSLRA